MRKSVNARPKGLLRKGRSYYVAAPLGNHYVAARRWRAHTDILGGSFIRLHATRRKARRDAQSLRRGMIIRISVNLAVVFLITIGLIMAIQSVIEQRRDIAPYMGFPEKIRSNKPGTWV